MFQVSETSLIGSQTTLIRSSEDLQKNEENVKMKGDRFLISHAEVECLGFSNI